MVTLSLIGLRCVHAGLANDESDLVRRALLWRAQPPNGGPASYLFGTVHVGVAVEDLPSAVLAALRASPCFVMEADGSAVNPIDVMTMAALPPGQHLSQMLKPAAWQAVKEAVGSKLGSTRLDHLQPWFVSIMMLQAHAPAGPAMDDDLVARAKHDGKQIHYLETWQEALKVYASITTPADLEDLALNPDESDKEMATMLAAYRSGDSELVQKAIAEVDSSTPDGPAKSAALIVGRNNVWLPRLHAQIDKTNCFVAVGAGHLLGAGNLRDRLAATGWHIERVESLRRE